MFTEWSIFGKVNLIRRCSFFILHNYLPKISHLLGILEFVCFSRLRHWPHITPFQAPNQLFVFFPLSASAPSTKRNWLVLDVWLKTLLNEHFTFSCTTRWNNATLICKTCCWVWVCVLLLVVKQWCFPWFHLQPYHNNNVIASILKSILNSPNSQSYTKQTHFSAIYSRIVSYYSILVIHYKWIVSFILSICYGICGFNRSPLRNFRHAGVYDDEGECCFGFFIWCPAVLLPLSRFIFAETYKSL